MFVGVVLAGFVGIFIVDTNQSGLNFVLVKYVIAPGFLVVFSYSVVLLLPWLSKEILGLRLNKLSEMAFSPPKTGFAAQIIFFTYCAAASLMSLLCGYLISIFFILNIKYIIFKGGI